VKGGLREGAGRPPTGIRKQTLVLRLRSEVVNSLRREVPTKQRSAWVERLIERELKNSAPDFLVDSDAE